jgi:YgiT-type zinc finger domain-containing protein
MIDDPLAMNPETHGLTCPDCRTGKLQSKFITYANWHAGQFVIAPNTPAWWCAVCGHVELQAAMVNRLLSLLGPASRPIAAHARSGLQINSDLFQNPSSTRKYQ